LEEKLKLLQANINNLDSKLSDIKSTNMRSDGIIRRQKEERVSQE